MLGGFFPIFTICNISVTDSDPCRRKSIDEAMKELVNAKKKYRNIEKQFKTLEQFHQTVQVVLTDRVNDWKVLRSLTAKQIRASFLTFLSQKGHTGSIKFDHNQKTLDITVQLEKLRDGSHSHSQTVNSLSGGERSFSTVSLLMALWTTMETPFTAMDEFDVFMVLLPFYSLQISANLSYYE